MTTFLPEAASQEPNPIERRHEKEKKITRLETELEVLSRLDAASSRNVHETSAEADREIAEKMAEVAHLAVDMLVDGVITESELSGFVDIRAAYQYGSVSARNFENAVRSEMLARLQGRRTPSTELIAPSADVKAYASEILY